MSAEIIAFPGLGSGGLVYVVSGACDEIPDDRSWLVYSQAADAHEPELEAMHTSLEPALAEGRQLATRRRARFLFDRGSSD